MLRQSVRQHAGGCASQPPEPAAAAGVPMPSSLILLICVLHPAVEAHGNAFDQPCSLTYARPGQIPILRACVHGVEALPRLELKMLVKLSSTTYHPPEVHNLEIGCLNIWTLLKYAVGPKAHLRPAPGPRGGAAGAWSTPYGLDAPDGGHARAASASASASDARPKSLAVDQVPAMLPRDPGARQELPPPLRLQSEAPSYEGMPRLLRGKTSRSAALHVISWRGWWLVARYLAGQHASTA